REIRRFDEHLLRERLVPGVFHQAIAFSPDSKTLASGVYNDALRVWDTTTGKKLGQYRFHPSYLNQICTISFLTDARTVVVGSPNEQGFRAYEVASGKEIGKFPLLSSRYMSSLAISPDGKTLASGGWGDQRIHLWEMATGQERGQFLNENQGRVHVLAFSPDGRSLAAGNADTTAVVWDLTGRMQDGRLPPVTLSAEELEIQWQELGSADARRAYRALWTLVADSPQAVPFLQARLTPPAVDAQRIAALIAALDRDEFAVRQQASEALEKLGEVMGPALRQVLQGKPSLELRHRVERLLAKLENEQLRSRRAVEVLERIGTEAAIAVFEVLAKGSSQTCLTQEANSALERLPKRSGIAR